MKLLSLPSALALASLATALPAEDHTLSKRSAYNPPRNQIYVQTFRNTTGGQFSMLPLFQTPTQITHLYLASLRINSDPKAITLNDTNPNDTIWNTVWFETAQIQAKGVKVLMSIGGAAAGSYPRLYSGTNGAINETYYRPLYHTLKSHNLDGVNLDIAEQVKYTLSARPPPALQSGLRNGWGDASSPNGYRAIVTNGYAASRVSLGVLDHPNDGGSGWFNLTKYQATVRSLRFTYGSSFGGVIGWEYWDAGARDGLPQPYQWVAPIGASAFGTAKKRDVDEVEGELVERQTDPISYGPAPFPELMSKLESLGARHIAAVRALNISCGDLGGALQILGLNLLDGLGGEEVEIGMYRQ